MPKNKDQKFKIEFTIQFMKIRDLPKSLHGSELWLECKRGKKTQHEWSTERQSFDDGTEIGIDEKHKWELSLKQNDKKQWEKKELSISLREGKGKGKEIGKAVLGLHNFADNGTIRTEIVTLAMSKKDKNATRQPSIGTKVSAYWTQMGDKSLMKREESKKSYSHEKETDFVGSLVPKKTKDEDEEEEEEKKPVAKGKNAPAKVNKVSDSEEEEKPPVKNSKSAPSKQVKKESESEEDKEEEEEEEEKKPTSSKRTKKLSSYSDDEEEEQKPTPKSGTLRSQKEEFSKKEQRQREQDEARNDLFNKNLKEKEKEKPKTKVEVDRDELFGNAKSNISSAKVPKKVVDSDEEDGNAGAFDKEAMQAEIDDLKTDKSRLEKKVERLMKENEDLKAKLQEAQSKIKDDDDEGPSSKKKQKDDDDEVEDLKRDKSRLERKLEKLQKEFDEFKENSAKQMEDARRNSFASSSATLKDDKKGKILSKKEDSKASDYQYKQLQKERDEQSKEMEKLSKKLESANAVNEELLATILNGIKVNSTEVYLLFKYLTLKQNIDEPSVLAFWLSFAGNLFRVLKHEMPADIRFDKDLLEKEEIEEDLDEMEPVDKFFHELIHVSFDIFGIMVQLFYKQLDNVLVPSILEQNTSGKSDIVNTDFPNIIGKIMDVLIKTNIPETLIKKILNQIFYFVDAQRPNLYTCSFGFQIKMIISKVENAITRVNKQYYNTSENLNYTKEAANLLVMDKNIVSDEGTRNQIFTHLNVVQIYHIVKNFRPDEFAPEAVPDSVKRSLDDACSRQRGLPLQVNSSDMKRINLLCAL